MSQKKYIHDFLKKEVLDNFAESKSVGSWWDNLPGKRRKKVVGILGMSKGKDNSLFDKLDPDEQAEISAYFGKHQGRVESSAEEEIDRRKKLKRWKGVEKAVIGYNKALHDLSDALSMYKLLAISAGGEETMADDVEMVRSQMGKEIKIK